MWSVRKDSALIVRTVVTWGSRKELPCVMEVGTLRNKLIRKRDSELRLAIWDPEWVHEYAPTSGYGEAA